MDRAALLIFLACLTGCAIVPKDMNQYTSLQLCERVGSSIAGRGPLLDELEKRKAISGSERQMIERFDVRPGMSETAMICSWGVPSSLGDINRTDTEHATRKQYVWRDCRQCEARYAYVRDGKVVSVQTSGEA